MQTDISKAVRVLQTGGLVAFPTETVYGLGADAKNPAAVKKIFQAKQRPMDHPLIVHLASITELPDWADAISEEAMALARAFWPGALTLLFKKKSTVLNEVTGGQETVGLRIPAHPMAQALLHAFGSGIAAPSANRFGRISPTTAEAVREELGPEVDFILNGGACEIGVESTIVDMSGTSPCVLRPGMIGKEHIEKVLKQPLSLKARSVPRVSGSHESHYAPQTPVLLLSRSSITAFLEKHVFSQTSIAVMSFERFSFSFPFISEVLMPNDPKQYAHDLYHTLRHLDHQGFQYIVIETVPSSSNWEAIHDRLQRASFATTLAG